METNTLPALDASENPTGCCPRFKPEGWDLRHLHFDEKLFVRAETRSLAHIPVNMGKVFERVQAQMEASGAFDPDDVIVLSRDLSPWKAEHYFAVSKPVDGEEMTTLSGDFITKVFEGPYREARDWMVQMEKVVEDEGKQPSEIYFFYTTCPKCAKVYGKNYVVGVARL